VEIRAFVAENAKVESVVLAANEIARYSEVASTRVVTQEEALARARKELGEFSDVFEAGILPASLDVRLKPGFRDPKTVRAVADRMKTYDFIEDVRFGEEWVQKLYRIRNIATLAGMMLGLAFAAVAVIIIGSTIRMAVLARAREIAVMRLVGATDAFIRSPFLIEGALKGTLGGLLALLLTWTANETIGRFVFRAEFFDVRMAVLGVIAGALIGLMGSAVSVGRHLRDV